MRFISIILLIFLSSHGYSQFGDSVFYLIDSVNIKNITEYDRELLNSSLENYHKANHDTIRLKNLQKLAEELNSEELWPRYNKLMLLLVEKMLSANKFSNQNEEHRVKQWYASAINNFGFLEQARGNFDNALKFYEKCLKIQEEISHAGGMATTYSNIGIVYEDRGKISQALNYYEKSLSIRYQIHDSAGIAASINNIGAVYYNQGNIEKALEYWHKSLVIKEKLGDKGSAAFTLNNLGQIYSNQGDIENGINYYKKSLKFYNEVGNKKGSALVLGNLGANYNSMGNPEKALENYQESLEMRKVIGDKWGTIHSYYNISAVYYDKGVNSDSTSKSTYLATALDYNKTGLAIAIEINDKQLKSIGFASLAQTELALDLLNSAKESAQTSLLLAKELGYPDKISEPAKLLFLIHKANKSWEDALVMYELHIQMRDSIKNEETQKATIRQQTKYEFEKAQIIEEQARDEEQRIKNEALTRRDNLQYSIIFIGLLVLFTVVLFALPKVSLHWGDGREAYIAEGLIFFTFLLFFEFCLVLLDPYIENFSGGEPAFKLLFNAVLAGGIFPVHAFFENKLKNRLVSK